ncbi:hypothetical protein DF947_19065 [Pedobacter paludis]|uniref:Uncharacterized protein n=1 Tax=Pedobacter paludis TaxID=2203212 RepID=A0A317EWE8_9SPHI|nr:hypothetical protein DF947_19065 [Pedobacter paludis]
MVYLENNFNENIESKLRYIIARNGLPSKTSEFKKTQIVPRGNEKTSFSIEEQEYLKIKNNNSYRNCRYV